MQYLDKSEILRKQDLLTIVQRYTTIQKVASTDGGEWAGPCPFCGGNDRFRVHPNHAGGGRWMCRQCAPGWNHTLIDFTMQAESCDFKAALQKLSHGVVTTSKYISKSLVDKTPATLTISTSEWQKQAKAALAESAEALWRPQNAAGLDYLYNRGLKDRTIRHFQLGFSAGMKVGELWIPRGITIPNVVNGRVWYFKVRLLTGEPCRCNHCKRIMPGPGVCPSCGKVTKYLGVKGNRTASIFNAEDLPTATVALICEGEMNAITAWQEINDVIAVASVGSATNRIDLANWGPYFFYPKLILVTFDDDAAGQTGANTLLSMSEKCRPALPPSPDTDLNDFYSHGGNLWRWVKDYLDQYDPIINQEVA